MVRNILEAGHIFVKTIHDLFSGTSKLLLVHESQVLGESSFALRNVQSLEGTALS